MLKFGDKVVVNRDFYKNVKGVIIGFDELSNTYEVQLPHGIIKGFFGSNLKKTKRGAKK